jgi:hypothetical protein
MISHMGQEGVFMDSSEMIVLRRDLLQALRSLQDAARGKTPPELQLHSESGRLVFQVGDSKTRIPGEGSLPGRACISGLLVKVLPKMIPATSEIVIARVDDRIAFGKNRIGCRWEDSLLDEISHPLQENWLEALCLRERYSLREIEELGQSQRYQSALQERDQRISKAYESLAILGVSREELTVLVELSIRRLWREE